MFVTSGLLILNRSCSTCIGRHGSGDQSLVSKGTAPIEPAAIDSEKTIFRVDLRELGWDERPFEIFHDKKAVKK